MELGNELFFWCGVLIFARQREKEFGMFFAFLGGVFDFFGGDFTFLGVISRFWVYFRAMRPFINSRAARIFF